MAKKPTYEELEQRAKKLEEGEERYRSLFENMSDGAAIYEAKNEGEDFTFIDFNKAGEMIDNIHKEFLIGKGVMEVFPSVSLRVSHIIWNQNI